MSILIRQARVELSEQIDSAAQPIVLIRCLGPIRLDVVLFSVVACCVVLSMVIFAALLAPAGSDAFMLVWHSFMGLFATVLACSMLHHIALEEEVIVSRHATTRRILLGTRTIRRQTLEHVDGVEIDLGRIRLVSRIYAEVNGAIIGMDEQPHGLILRTGGGALWIGRKLWTPEDRARFEEAVRTAFRTCSVARAVRTDRS